MTIKFSPRPPLIQIEPYNCGSMIKGHLEQLEMIAAFSMDIVSAGSPSLHHLAFLDSVVRILRGVTPSVMGIILKVMSGSQVFCHKLVLNLEVKAPMYDTNAEAKSASPIIVKVCPLSILTVLSHLLFSPDKPFTNLIAADSLFSQAYASASTAAF